MILPELVYHAPTSLSEAMALLLEAPAARILAGGTDLIVMMKEGRAAPPRLVSLRRIERLHRVELEGAGVTIGSAATIGDIHRSGLLDGHAAFADMVPLMATPQIRNRATIGGNLCTAAACADTPPVLLVADAETEIEGPSGQRAVPLSRFFVGVRRTCLQPGEILGSVRIPRVMPASAYVKFGVRGAGNVAQVGVAAAVTLDGERVNDLRVAFTAAAPTPVLLDAEELGFTSAVPSRDLIEAVAEAASERARPISDLRGSAGYRRHLVGVGVRRALRRAFARAGRPIDG